MNGFDSTSIKYGPCGNDTGNFTAPVIEINPGFSFVFYALSLALPLSLVFICLQLVRPWLFDFFLSTSVLIGVHRSFHDAYPAIHPAQRIWLGILFV